MTEMVLSTQQYLAQELTTGPKCVCQDEPDGTSQLSMCSADESLHVVMPVAYPFILQVGDLVEHPPWQKALGDVEFGPIARRVIITDSNGMHHILCYRDPYFGGTGTCKTYTGTRAQLQTGRLNIVARTIFLLAAGGQLYRGGPDYTPGLEKLIKQQLKDNGKSSTLPICNISTR